MDITVVVGVAIAIGILVAIGAAFLRLGDQWATRASTKHGDFFPTLHLIAIAAGGVGAFVAGLAFASDHPKKWLHLTLPFVFVAVVYGYALRFDRGAWISLGRDIRDRLTRRDAV